MIVALLDGAILLRAIRACIGQIRVVHVEEMLRECIGAVKHQMIYRAGARAVAVLTGEGIA